MWYIYFDDDHFWTEPSIADVKKNMLDINVSALYKYGIGCENALILMVKDAIEQPHEYKFKYGKFRLERRVKK